MQINALNAIPIRVRVPFIELGRDIIDVAEQAGPGRWGISNYEDGFRLNVGWTELLTVMPDYARLIISRPSASLPPLPSGFTIHAGTDTRGFYPSIPSSELVVCDYATLSDLQVGIECLRSSITHAVTLASRRRAGRGVKSGHSEELARRLEKEIRRPFPTPPYVTLAGSGSHATHLLTTPSRSRKVKCDTAAFESLESLDSQRTTLRRVEQQMTRQFVLRGATTARCVFCGHEFPAALIVAAHIKPRAACTLKEKKAVDVNIIALCKLGCDELYERGYIEIEDGVIRAGPASPLTEPVRQAVDALDGQNILGWSETREPYFRWRRLNRGLGAATDAQP